MAFSENEKPPTQPPIATEEPILKFFAYEHLPKGLQFVSRGFSEQARWMVDNLPRNAERSAGLRKLLEAKDCAVRAAV